MVKENPTLPGKLKTTVWGIPVDLHSLEEFIPKISPHVLRTIVRNDRARTIEQLKQYSSRKKNKINTGTLMLILFCAIIAIGGVILLMFMPDITAFFSGMFGG